MMMMMIDERMYFMLFVYLLLNGCKLWVVCAENLTPAEQKKLRNKQRKKAKQEAMKREKQKQEEQQKQQQQQQQGKTRSQDAELDGPKEEELVPEKLERVSIWLDGLLCRDDVGCWAVKSLVCGSHWLTLRSVLYVINWC